MSGKIEGRIIQLVCFGAASGRHSVFFYTGFPALHHDRPTRQYRLVKPFLAYQQKRINCCIGDSEM
jgi:hypothetical protein